MSSSSTPPGVHVYRLRGIVDGREKTLDLNAGEHAVGNSRSADVILPVTGVSRRHARLKVTPNALLVEDLGSTNGTLVDGTRVVERLRVPVGAEIRFGPVSLRVETAAGDDAELAIDLWPSAATEAAAILPGFGSEFPTQELGEEPPEPGAPPRERLVFPAGYRPGTSPPMAALYAQMRLLLPGDLPILIRGETGVGKELVARILHASSERAERPFVAVNCAAVPAELLEAEMFGIGRGVATGVEARKGKFQLAAGGTLFLDEIGEMAPALQAKLLRALQDKEIQPVGERPQTIDVRVVAATNVDLTRHIEQGALRGDLYYRLAGFVLEVPALRLCPEDVPGLVEYFLRRFSEETGIRVRGLTVAALRVLSSYAWPGNVRELEHEVRRLVYLGAVGDVLTSERLSGQLHDSPQPTDAAARLVAELDTLELAPTLQAIEERMIREALRRAGGKKVEACRLLGLSRNGLNKKLKRLGIEVRALER